MPQKRSVPPIAPPTPSKKKVGGQLEGALSFLDRGMGKDPIEVKRS